MLNRIRERPQLWAFLFAVLIALATVPRARKLQSPDFKVFYTAARHALVEPSNVYKVSPDRYLYPPSTAVLLIPFAFSDHYAFHQWVWHGLLALMVFLLAAPSLASLAAMVLLTRYLAISFGYGQINLVVMALMSGVGLWLTSRPLRAGAVWALVASLKVYPLVLAPAFFSRARRGIFAAFLAGLALFLLPFAFWGPTLGLQLYQEFLQGLQSKGMPLESHNQSLLAFLLRLFTEQEFRLQNIGQLNWSLASFPPGYVKAVALGVGLTFTAASWLRAIRRRTNDALLSAAAFSIIFLSHIVWKDYLLLLFFPLAEIFRGSERKASFLLAGAFLILVTFSSPDFLGAAAAAKLDAACIHLWAAVLVWCVWLKK